MAMSSVIAFSNALKVAIAARQRALVVLLVPAPREIDDRAGRPRRTGARRSAWVATIVPLPGSERPSASVRQFIELAVNMPEHEPQVGQAERSITATSASETSSVGGGDHRVDEVDGCACRSRA